MPSPRRRCDRYSSGHAGSRRVWLWQNSKLLDFSGELAMPEDLADAILFLASDQSRYVNGEEIKCDGGWTCF